MSVSRFAGKVYGGIESSPWSKTITAYGGRKRLINDDNLALIEGTRTNPYETYILYSDLLTDPTVGACLDIINSEIVSRELVIEPRGSSKDDLKLADFLRDIFTNIPFYASDSAPNPEPQLNGMQEVAVQQQQTNGIEGWNRFMVNGVFVGTAPSEWMLTTDDGYIVPERIEARDVRRYQYDVDDQGLIYPKLMKDFNTYEGEYLPGRKFVIFNYKIQPNENPHGIGLGRRCYYPVAFKRELASLILAGAGKFAIPTIFYTFPEDMGLADRDQLYDDVVDMRENSVFGAEEGVNLEFKTASLSGAGDYVENAMKFYDNQIAMSIINCPLDKFYDKYKDLQKLIAKRAQAVSKEIDSIVNSTYVKWLSQYNFPQVKYPPKVYRRFTDATELEEFISNVLNLHAVGYQVSPEYIEAITGYPMVKKPENQPLDPQSEINQLKGLEEQPIEEDKEMQDNGEQDN